MVGLWAGGDDARQEGVLESGISGPVAVDLGASGALEDPAGLRVAEGPVSAHVSQMISTEFDDWDVYYERGRKPK